MAERKNRPTPRSGTKLRRVFKGREYVLSVVQTDDGAGYEVGGKVYASLSGAAKAITKNKANGWRFWGLD